MIKQKLKLFSILLCYNTIVADEQSSEKCILVYCGAGMRLPMDEIGELFE